MEMACNEIKTRYNSRHAMCGGVFDVVSDAVSGMCREWHVVGDPPLYDVSFDGNTLTSRLIVDASH